MPLDFPVQGFVSALGYQVHPSDVFVATYPKCGTTWMQYIVWLLAQGGRPLGANERLTDVFPHLEEVGRDFVERLPEPRLIKTHLPFAMTPWHPEARYVYVARNPFDCVVSFYHHTRGFVEHYDFADGTFDDYFECFMDGDVDFGGYFDNLVPWAAHADEGNVLFTTFERMRSDPRAVVLEVARFLGDPFAAADSDPDLADRVLEHSSFGRMREDQQRWSSARPEDAPPFIRRGAVGDWESHISPSQARRLATEFSRRTRGSRVADLWPDVLARARELAVGS